MSDEPKVQFEQTLQGAIKASLDGRRCQPEVRARLLERLARETKRAPAGIKEGELARFEAAMVCAVRAQQSRTAPPELRQAVLEAVQRASTTAVTTAPPESAPAAPRASKVAALHVRPRWKRALTAAATIAAGFALFFGTLMGGAEEALAESVRQDHKRCCESLKASEMASCPPFNSAEFGPLPQTRVTGGWTLVASRMCRTTEGGPMVHNVYLRDGATISLHFLPPSAAAKPDSKPRQIAQGEFPVIAWESSGWTVTACSSDLDMGTLASAVGCMPPR